MLCENKIYKKVKLLQSGIRNTTFRIVMPGRIITQQLSYPKSDFKKQKRETIKVISTISTLRPMNYYFEILKKLIRPDLNPSLQKFDAGALPQSLEVVSIDLFWVFFMPFSYNEVYF